MQPTTPKHILTAEQFNQGELLDELMEGAERYSSVQEAPENRSQFVGKHAGKILFNIFYEPSTRTSFSFRTAASNLGMTVIGTEAAGQFSSAAKGETLEDTTRMLTGNKPDVIVLRHPEDGAAERMAVISADVPIINAGDGRNEHPTQALLDVYTIQKEFGRRDNLRIVIGGDIAGGRTAKSLLKLLGIHKTNSFGLIAPETTNATPDMKKDLAKIAADVDYSYELSPEALREADVVYWTRTQTERGSGQQDDNFTLRRADLTLMNKDGIVMHPLPRKNELSTDIDDDPRARYFQQAANGLPVRMALLDWILTPPAAVRYHTMTAIVEGEVMRVNGLIKTDGASDSQQYQQMYEKLVKAFERETGRKAEPGEVRVYTHWKQGDKGPKE